MMAVTVVRMQDDFSGPARQVAASAGVARDAMGRFASSSKGLSDQMGQGSTSVQGFSVKLANMSTLTRKTGTDIQNLNPSVSGLAKYFAEGTASGMGFEQMFTGLAANIDPVALAINVTTVAIEAMVGAAVAGAAALAGLMIAAISVTQSATQFKNTMQALTGDGAGTVAMVNDLAQTLPQGKAAIKGWATELAKTGLAGDALKKSIEAVAASDAIMRDAGAGATALLNRLNQMADAGQNVKLDRRFVNTMESAGVSVKDLASYMGVSVEQLNKMKLSADHVSKAVQNILVKKGAGPLGDMALEWDSILAKLEDGLTSVFSDPAIAAAAKEFMTAVKDLFGVFGKGTTGTQTLASMVKTILIPAFHYATAAIKELHYTVSLMINWFLKGAIAFNTFRNSAMGALILDEIFAGLAAAVIMVAGVVLVVAGGLSILIGTALAAGAAIMLLITAVEQFASAMGDGASVVADWIAGIVSGIAGGASSVFAAIANLAAGMVSTFKGALGIASPSAVMIAQGRFIGAGAAQGIQESSGQVQQAAQGMAGGAVSGAAKGGAPQASGGQQSGGGMQVTLAAGAIQISGAGSPAETLALTENAIALLFERIALERGLVA